jgi:hypothetical protein
MPKKKPNNYIDNEKFFKEMVLWKKKVTKSENLGKKKPPVTDYIGICFMEIAENLVRRPNFASYPFKDDMVGDAIENCLMYCSNFDPEKSQNPFAYFTQIIYYAFLRRIQKEKKQNYVKYKYLNHLDTKGDFSELLKQFDFHEEEKEYFRKLHEKEVNKKKKLRKRRKKNV